MKTIISNIDVKVRRLIARLAQLQLERSDLQEDKSALTKRLEEKEEEVRALQEKVKLINISKSVDINKEDVKATRRKINEYVREIDRCIALLNK